MNKRDSRIDMTGDEFRTIGRELIEKIAELLDGMNDRKVTAGLAPDEIRKRLDAEADLPADGNNAADIVGRTADLLMQLSLYNGHPKFGGYITSSPAPIGILGDFLAAAINPNVGGWTLSPAATEIELQTVRWVAQLIGYPSDCGGLMVSGGNMANISCLMAARTDRADWNVREDGMHGKRLLLYASSETHTWLHKCADMMGLGTKNIRWIETDESQRIDIAALRRQLDADSNGNAQPFCVIGTAGTVSTGVIDPLDELADICNEYKLWYHVDGAYGGFGAVLPELAEEYRGMERADSIAIDPHKWLYAPMEAGCVLVRNAEALRNAFSYRPPYYHFEDEAVSFVDYGPQNSRGFRALKVRLALEQLGRSGYEALIREDCRLAKHLYDIMQEHDEFEAYTYNLSIATFRYVPQDLRERAQEDSVGDYLNELNTEIQNRLERSGDAFLSNAVINDTYVLRWCIVNFRTSQDDIDTIPDIVGRLGKASDSELRPPDLR